MKRSYSNQKKSDDVFIYMYNPSLEPTPMPNIENPMQSSIASDSNIPDSKFAWAAIVSAIVAIRVTIKALFTFESGILINRCQLRFIYINIIIYTTDYS